MLNYSYEIKTFADDDSKIEIVYTLSDGQTRHIECEQPKDVESINDLVKAYEPMAFWDVPEIQPVWPEPEPGTIAPVQLQNSIPVSEM